MKAVNKGVNDAKIKWARSFYIKTDGFSDFASGRTVHMAFGEVATFYAQVYVPNKIHDALLGTNIAADLWMR